ncbi:MAG: 4-hydroxyacetophenone monooxygenase, partial [Nocardioides sp.]
PGLGHSRLVLMIASQFDYVRAALRTKTLNHYATVEPRLDAQEGWNAELQKRLRRSVWNSGGCASWYLDEHGRNTVLWPRTTFAFRNLLSQFDAAAYDVTAAAHTPEKVTA